MGERLEKLKAMLKKEQERRIKLNNRIAILERRIQEESAAEVADMVRTANVTPEQLAILLRQAATMPPSPAALSAVGVEFDKEEAENDDYEIWCATAVGCAVHRHGSSGIRLWG